MLEAKRRQLGDDDDEVLHVEKVPTPVKRRLRLVKDGDDQEDQAKQTKDEFSRRVNDVLSRSREFTDLRREANKVMDKLPEGPSKERLQKLVGQALASNFAPEELWVLKYELDQMKKLNPEQLRARDYGVILDDALAAIDEEDQQTEEPIIAKKGGEVATVETKADFRKRIATAKERVTELLRQVSSLTPTDRKKLRGLPEQLNKHLLALDSLKSRPYNEEAENLFKQADAATDDFKVELNRKLLEITATGGSGEPKSKKSAGQGGASERYGGQGAAAGGGEGGDDGGPPYDFITVPETGERIAIREIEENIDTFAERLEILRDKGTVDQREYEYLKARLASARGEWEGPKGVGEQLRRIGRVDQSVPVVRRYGELMTGVKDAIETLEAKWLSQVTGGAGQSPESAADGEIANLHSRLEGIVEGLETFGVDLTTEKNEIEEAVFVKSQQWLASLEQDLVGRLDQILEDEKEYAIALQNDLDLARDQGEITDERHAEFSKLVKRLTAIFGLVKALRDANNYASFSGNLSHYLRLKDVLYRAFVEERGKWQAEKKQERPNEQVDRLFEQIQEYYNQTLQPNFRQLQSLNPTAALELHELRTSIYNMISIASREILSKSVKETNDVDRLKDILERLSRLNAVVLMRIKLTAPDSSHKKPEVKSGTSSEPTISEPSIIVEAGMPSATVDTSKSSRSAAEQDLDEFIRICGGQVRDGQNVGNFVNRLVLLACSKKGIGPDRVASVTERVMPRMGEVYATQDPQEAFELLRRFISETMTVVVHELVDTSLRQEVALSVKGYSDQIRQILLDGSETDLQQLLAGIIFRIYNKYYQDSPQDVSRITEGVAKRIAGKLFSQLNFTSAEVKLTLQARLYFWNKYSKGQEAEKEADLRLYRRRRVLDDPTFMGHPSLLPNIISQELSKIGVSADIRPEALPKPILYGVVGHRDTTKLQPRPAAEEKKKPTLMTRLARWRKAAAAGALAALGIGGGAVVVREMLKDEADDGAVQVARQERKKVSRPGQEAGQKAPVVTKRVGGDSAKPAQKPVEQPTVVGDDFEFSPVPVSLTKPEPTKRKTTLAPTARTRRSEKKLSQKSDADWEPIIPEWAKDGVESAGSTRLAAENLLKGMNPRNDYYYNRDLGFDLNRWCEEGRVFRTGESAALGTHGRILVQEAVDDFLDQLRRLVEQKNREGIDRLISWAMADGFDFTDSEGRNLLPMLVDLNKGYAAPQPIPPREEFEPVKLVGSRADKRTGSKTYTMRKGKESVRYTLPGVKGDKTVRQLVDEAAPPGEIDSKQILDDLTQEFGQDSGVKRNK